LLNKEAGDIVISIENKLKNAKNLTLGLDGWTSPLGHSFYAFIIITETRSEIVYSLKDLSAEKHTAEFISKEIKFILEKVGVNKFAAVVSDAAATMVAAKRLVHQIYPSVYPIRCIAHHVHLISSDICKMDWTKSTLKKCNQIVKYFKLSHQAGANLRKEKKSCSLVGGGLRTYVITRWTTAWDCTTSILRLENCLKNVSTYLFYINNIQIQCINF
jgi:hypothetical protein